MTSPPDPLVPFATLSRETAFDAAPFFVVERMRRRSGRTGAVRDAYRLVGNDWVHVVATTGDGNLLLVRQERHGLEAETLELPGGVVDPGEDPAAAATRELLEETGHAGSPPVLLGSLHPNPALQANRLWTFLVRDCVRVGEAAGDGEEEIEVVSVPVARVPDLVRRGDITHALVVAALWLWGSSPR